MCATRGGVGSGERHSREIEIRRMAQMIGSSRKRVEWLEYHGYGGSISLAHGAIDRRRGQNRYPGYGGSINLAHGAID